MIPKKKVWFYRYCQTVQYDRTGMPVQYRYHIIAYSSTRYKFFLGFLLSLQQKQFRISIIMYDRLRSATCGSAATNINRLN